MNAAILVPTLNAGSLWEHWINALLVSGVNASDIYIIDSCSEDKTVIQANAAGFNVKHIDACTFNHGGTRRSAVATLEGYDFVVFLTQDAVLCKYDSIKDILLPFADDKVAAVCGRQLHRNNAGFIERHARFYNYPSKSFTRSLKEVKTFGLKTAFISNSFAAYRVSTLNEIDGFPKDVIFGEDMYVATKLLKAGYRIAYSAEACVYHSHGYSLWQEMQRYFDMGVFHAREPWIREELGGAEGEGVKFVISEFKYLFKHAFWLIPEGMLRALFRYTGFRLGLIEKRLPQWLKRRLAMNKGFFNSN